MKHLMKTAILLASVLFLTISTQAQVKFGVKAGLNTSTLSGMDGLYETASANVNVKSRLGFHGGLVAQLNLPSNLFLQPELLFSIQGDKESYEGETETSALNYIQLPIYAGYKFDAGLGLNIIFGVGPYFAYGISATDDAFDELFKRFDAGISALGGVQFNQFQITVGYDLGLVDICDVNGWETAKDLAGLSSISNRNLKVSVACFF
jgi:hypothetical protein